MNEKNKSTSKMTQEEIVKISSSMCGACAEIIFTGVCLHEHDKTCRRGKHARLRMRSLK